MSTITTIPRAAEPQDFATTTVRFGILGARAGRRGWRSCGVEERKGGGMCLGPLPPLVSLVLVLALALRLRCCIALSCAPELTFVVAAGAPQGPTGTFCARHRKLQPPRPWASFSNPTQLEKWLADLA
jgi:hypothetical protein